MASLSLPSQPDPVYELNTHEATQPWLTPNGARSPPCLRASSRALSRATRCDHYTLVVECSGPSMSLAAKELPLPEQRCRAFDASSMTSVCLGSDCPFWIVAAPATRGARGPSGAHPRWGLATRRVRSRLHRARSRPRRARAARARARAAHAGREQPPKDPAALPVSAAKA